jgi:hypothetical protein
VSSRRLVACSLLAIFSSSVALSAQDWHPVGAKQASARIAIVAVKRGTIELSIRTVPLSFELENSRSSAALDIPFTTRWNVSPAEVNAVEVIAYFDDPQRALLGTGEEAIESKHIRGRRVGDSHFRPFSETAVFGPPRGSLKLFTERISSVNARGMRHDTLELLLDAPGSRQNTSARYTGTLHLEARYY